MISLYRPGTSVIHRMPAGPKALLVAVLAVSITIFAASAVTVPAAVVVVVLGYLIAGLGFRELARQIWALRIVILFMLVSGVLFLPVVTGVLTTIRVVAVVLLAGLIALTTRVPDLLDSIESGLGPLRRFGVNPAKIGLVLALTITAIPVIAGFAATIREAQRARGVPIRLTTFVVPLLVMSLKHSDDLADALAARGVE